MNAVAIQCDSYLEAPATPRSGSYFFTAAAPARSPGETLLEARNNVMREFLHFALLEDDYEPSEGARENFDALIQLLPPSLPATEPRISSFGSICLDWDMDPDNLLSIMLQANNKITYAANFSGEKAHGSVDFQAGRLPKELLAEVAKWIRRSR